MLRRVRIVAPVLFLIPIMMACAIPRDSLPRELFASYREHLVEPDPYAVDLPRCSKLPEASRWLAEKRRAGEISSANAFDYDEERAWIRQACASVGGMLQ